LIDILTHEFAHVRRRDQCVVLMQTLARSLFWPIVTIHWLNRELIRAREEVCDNFVLNHSTSTSYGRALLKVAELAIGTRPLPSSLGMLNWQGRVEKRIRGLLDERRNPRTSVGVSKGLLTLVAFLALATAICGTRYVEAEPSGIDQPTTKRPSERTQDDATAQSTPADTGYFRMIVQDCDGKPVADATVVLWNVGVRMGSRSVLTVYNDNSLKTASDGSVVIPYPKGGEGPHNRTDRLGLRIQHPDSPTWSGYRDVDDESPFQLARSTLVSVTAKAADGRPIDSDVYASTNGLRVDWTIESGTLHSGPMNVLGSRSSNLLRVVHGPENGPVLFSKLIDLSQVPRRDNVISIDAILQPSSRVVGRVSENVSRPVKNGRVIGSIVSGSAPFNGWHWSVVTGIEEDGSFVLDGLPAHDTLQIIALCDGWASLSPRPSEVTAYSETHGFEVRYNHGATTGHIAPQLHYVSRGITETTVRMHKTGNVRVRVVDREDKPIAGAKTNFSPNQILHNSGSTLLGAGFSTLELLRNPEIREQLRAKPLMPPGAIWSKYLATTDEKGEATVRDIPAHQTIYAHGGDEKEGPRSVGFYVRHQDYVLVPKEPRPTLSGAGPRESVELIPGETATIRVRMERKDEPKSIESRSTKLEM
jgi:hypothetical protein